ncbi:MAG: geranylgeranylglyceryl/heptaprenylglyceryl phosphate synthase [Chitinophagales bacterium]|nr:geranylgeranylglyceryl/heptaprenylglyceryl phosphate synthase [Chitinophagales bacterium]
MYQPIYSQFRESRANGQKKFSVLIDPDKVQLNKLWKMLDIAVDAGVDYFFLGGSLVVRTIAEQIIQAIRSKTDIPIVLFPGSPYQIHNEADAILYLSLISGRNPDLLIGNHVISAPIIKQSGLEVISTGYMLIDGGIPTSVQYMSNTTPIPAQKDEIALCTALAGEMLGMKQIFMDAGSGANHPVPISMIETVSKNIQIPLIIGGGINTPQKAADRAAAGADVIVVGNALEKNPELIHELSVAIHEQSRAPITKIL